MLYQLHYIITYFSIFLSLTNISDVIAPTNPPGGDEPGRFAKKHLKKLFNDIHDATKNKITQKVFAVDRSCIETDFDETIRDVRACAVSIMTQYLGTITALKLTSNSYFMKALFEAMHGYLTEMRKSSLFLYDEYIPLADAYHQVKKWYLENIHTTLPNYWKWNYPN